MSNAFDENEVSINAFGGTEISKRTLAERLDPELQSHFQVISSRVRELDPTKIRIFSCHDLPEDPESAKFRDQSFLDSIHKFVFVSNWQYGRYQLVHGLPYDTKSIVLESGIEPSPDSTLQKDNRTINLVYTSTPQRGLELLVPVFEQLCTLHSDIHLHVYSSFKIYGWDEADRQYEPLYERIRQHPQMTYHGFVQNNVLKNNLEQAHIFAYPCIWPETSCRAMLEAMSAGLICVHPNFAGLPDTSGGLNIMYQGNMNDPNEHMNTFASYLNSAVLLCKKEEANVQSMRNFNKVFVDSRFNLDKVAAQWNTMMRTLLKQYPTVESRAIPSKMFVYKA